MDSFQKVYNLYHYGRSNNISMNEIYDDVMKALLQNWDVAKHIDEYFQNKIVEIPKGSNITVDFTDDSEWTYFHRLRTIYANRKVYNWYPNRLGSFLVRRMIFDLNWNSDKKMTLNMADKMGYIFKFPESNLSLSNIAHLHSINDFEQIQNTDISPRLWNTREYLANFPKSLLDCINKESQYFKEEVAKVEDGEDLYEDEKIDPMKYMIRSPCAEKRHLESCLEYCELSKKLFQGSMTRKDFLKIMQFALPQGKTVIEQDLDEETLAKKIVGSTNTEKSQDMRHIHWSSFASTVKRNNGLVMTLECLLRSAKIFKLLQVKLVLV